MNCLESKHPRAIRYMHWVNVPVLVNPNTLQPA
jgi:hypothetical protein